MSDLWKNDKLQWARLLSEISACCTLSKTDTKALCQSMDLTPKQVTSLFERAQAYWDSYRNAQRVRERDAKPLPEPKCPKCGQLGEFETDWYVLMAIKAKATGMDVNDYTEGDWQDSGPVKGGLTECPTCGHIEASTAFGIACEPWPTTIQEETT